MQVKLNDQVLSLQNEPAAIEELFAQIDKVCRETGLLFTHMVINGTEVFGDYENFIKDNLKNIEEIEVIMRTPEQLQNEVFLSVHEYLERAIPGIKELVEEFYQGPKGESWTNLAQLLEGLQSINQITLLIDRSAKQPANWQDYKEIYAKLETELSNLNEAMEDSDLVLFADLLNYEILPLLETLDAEVKKIIAA